MRESPNTSSFWSAWESKVVICTTTTQRLVIGSNIVRVSINHPNWVVPVCVVHGLALSCESSIKHLESSHHNKSFTPVDSAVLEGPGKTSKPLDVSLHATRRRVFAIVARPQNLAVLKARG